MAHFRLLAVGIFASLAASGFAQTTTTLSFQLSGQTHSCVVHVPSGINKPPLVLFIHGANGSGAEFENDTKGDATADQDKFIAAYPSASSDGSTGTWNDMYGTTNFPFFLAIIDTLDARYHIDRNRVYMTGFSQGGIISFVAGCNYSDVFAAVAPVSGHSNTTCTLTRPVPMFMTFGTNDITAPPTFIADLDIWTNLDSCPSTPTITRPYPATNPNSGVTRISYGPCAQGSYVVADSIQGEGHQWPAANRLNQSNEVWAFFKQFSLNNPTEVRLLKLNAARDPISATYLSGIVRLRGVGENTRVLVRNTKGGAIAATVTRQGQFPFKGQPSGVYMVTVRASDGFHATKFIVP